ncbi:MAG: choice-of-anchor Q domain-containing protein [Candidatus Binatia bacterium]
MQPWLVGPVAVVAGFAISATPSRSHAASFTVNSTADAPDAIPGDGVCATSSGACTLRAAIEEANSSAGADAVAIPAGHYVLRAGELDITDDLTVTGAGAPVTQIDGNGRSRVLHIASPANVTLSQLTIHRGLVTLQHLDSGGGLLIDEGATATLTDVAIAQNKASGTDGGGCVNAGTATFTNVTFTRNQATNFAFGGGCVNYGSATLTNVTFVRNQIIGAGSNGGGFDNAGTATLTNVTFTANKIAGTSGSGGGLSLDGGPTTLTNVTFTNNRASGVFASGGGLANQGTSSITLTNVIFTGNKATGPKSRGGGLSSHGGPLTLTNVTFAGNQAAGFSSFGGGFANAGTITLTNVTLAANEAKGTHSSGGGLMNEGGLVTLASVTLAANQAAGGGNIDNEPGGTVTLINSIVAGRTDCQGAVTSLGHNIDSGNGCGFTGAGDLVNTDPLLGPLANNGGLAETMALLPGSPAIDAGDTTACPATDERGMPRLTDGHCDIGAFEAAP